MTTIEITDNETTINGIAHPGTPKKCGAAFAEACTRLVPETVVPVIEVWIGETLFARFWLTLTKKDGLRFASFKTKFFTDFWEEICPRGPTESAWAFQDGFNWWLLNYIKWTESEYAKKHDALTPPATFGELVQMKF